MRLIYKFNIGQNENISSLCQISNNLYNQALYIFRETLSKEDKWLSYFELDDIMKNTKNLDGDINYRLLKAQCSQQVLRILEDRKSTRLNSSHVSISYAVFCLKKKKKNKKQINDNLEQKSPLK